MSMSQDDPRLARVLSAVSLEPVDKVPVVIEGAAWCARVTGVKLADYCADNVVPVQASIDAFNLIEGADALNYYGIDPGLMGLMWMSRVKLPGVNLPEDELWQIEEQELLTRCDYDRIVTEGWGPFYGSYIEERLGTEVLEELERYAADEPKLHQLVAASGVPYLCGAGDVGIPFELLCGGRSFSKFIGDLFQIPDKVEAAMRMMMNGATDAGIEAAKQNGSPGIWVGGWRGASEMLSPALWERFVFPYHKQLTEDVAAAGLIPILHMDSDWTRDLARFLEYPAKHCILSLDGRTNIRKAKEILGDHMCIMGDVPPALLSNGTSEQVYEYCRQLISDIGPTGLILQSGCDIPPNAPLENVRAMALAAQDAAN